MESKLCERCKTPFERPADYHNARWARRRFCTRSCAAKSIQRPTSAGVCEDCGQWAQSRRFGKVCVPCYSRARYQREREHRLAVNRAWREAHPDYWDKDEFREAARERAWMRNFSGLRDEVLARDRSTCQDCGLVGVTGKAATDLCIHHVDGDHEHNDLENLVVLCNVCHPRRHAAQGDYFGEGRWAKRAA